MSKTHCLNLGIVFALVMILVLISNQEPPGGTGADSHTDELCDQAFSKRNLLN